MEKYDPQLSWAEINNLYPQEISDIKKYKLYCEFRMSKGLEIKEPKKHGRPSKTTSKTTSKRKKQKDYLDFRWLDKQFNY